MYGFIITKAIAAKDVDSYNRSAVATVDVQAGTPVVLAPGEKAEDPFVATLPVDGSLSGLYMAYNPAEVLTVVNEKEFAGLSNDPRDYTNIKERPFDVFKIKVGDIIGMTKDCFDATLTEAVDNTSFFEPKAGQATWTITATATVGSTAFKVITNGTLPFPATKDTIGMSNYSFVVGECVAE